MQAQPEIIHARLGGYDLYIPKEYVKLKNSGIGTESALLQAWYPGSGIVPGDSANQLWSQGLWWKHVMVLISQRKSNITFDEFSNKGHTHLDATVFVAHEYGLDHYTQPKNKVQDNYDLWLEKQNGKIISDITCTEKIVKTDVTQCSHNIFIGESFWFRISYDRRFLPEWKTIETNVISMFESFRSEEAARDFVLARMKEMRDPELGQSRG